ncbi:MAG: helix-turn-helix domain-containing protein, partial [Ruminococcus flavefaciens]|nr:helix-turn-helix domain-containing protein [Ruminococcus flavefaciens]
MQGQTVHIVSQAIRYIEDNLNDKLELDIVAAALHYSKFHLHRIFTKTVGLTIHEYTQRRQLTEAAKLLIFSKKPIIEIALISGYESQQAFSSIFKAMYKTSPAEFREAEEFYPLQLEIHLKEEAVTMDYTKEDIKFALSDDVEDWMELVSLTIDGYPCLNKDEYIKNLHRYIDDKKALLLRDEDMVIGAMGFSPDTGSIDFLAIHPQYRHLGITKLFLD